VSGSAYQPLARPPRLDSLTGLRFFAAFFILFAHSTEWLAPFKGNNPIAHYGGVTSIYGMPLFFVLSGFVIHYNYGQSFATLRFRWAAWQFLGARIARLYPLLVACFAVGLIVDRTLGWIPQHTNWWIGLVASFLTMTQSWFYIIIFDDRLLAQNAFGLAWSISSEFFFYLAYLGLVFLLLQLRSLRAAIIAWTVFGALAFLFFVECKTHLDGIGVLAQKYIEDYVPAEKNSANSFIFWLFYYSPYSRIFEFILGCLTAELYNQTYNRQISAVEERWAHFFMWGAMAVLGVIGYFFLFSYPFPTVSDYVMFMHQNFICAIPIAILIFCIARYDSSLSNFLCDARLILLGEMSYSIYSVHTWTLRIFIRDPADYSIPEVVDAVFRIALAITVTLILSSATYRLIEIPGRAGLRAFFSRLAAATLGPRAANIRGNQRPGLRDCAVAVSSLAVFIGIIVACQLRR
jgi:peptidoglycan/LPS O-acetylase OafA/YrhL